MSEIAHEIATQPACWRRAAARATEVVDVLPAAGARLAVVGCGTSLYIGRAFAALREAMGIGETDAFAASEFPHRRPYEAILAITRSGTTTEIVRVLDEVAGTRPTAAITADATAPAARVADRAVVLEFAEERSVVQTRFATSTLAALRASLGEDLDRCIADAERALRTDAVGDPGRFERFAFLGHGWTLGVAEEAALKMLEAAGVDAVAHPAMEYRHGPMSRCDERSLVWIMGSPDRSLAEEIRATGAEVRVGSLDPMAELVMVQRLAVALAHDRGLEPDRPRHLTRSVVLSAVIADGGKDRISGRMDGGTSGGTG